MYLYTVLYCLEMSLMLPSNDDVISNGDNNPTVMCDHQGCLVGKNIKQIVIQGITWDSCNGITIVSYIDVHVIECDFQNFNSSALTLQAYGQEVVVVNGNTFSSSVIIHGCNFCGNNKNGAVIISTTNTNDTIAK